MRNSSTGTVATKTKPPELWSGDRINPPGRLRWRFGPWRCNCFIVPNTCRWPFLQCLGIPGHPSVNLRSRDDVAAFLVVNFWGAKMRNDLNHKLGATNGRLGGVVTSIHFCEDTCNWVSLSIIFCTYMYLYLKMGQIFTDFNQPIFQPTDHGGESQLRSLYRSGKAFLQEQGNLVIWKISQGKHGHFLTFFGIDFASGVWTKVGFPGCC